MGQNVKSLKTVPLSHTSVPLTLYHLYFSLAYLRWTLVPCDKFTLNLMT